MDDFQNTKPDHRKRVCILGAGAAGLVAIRHVSRSPDLVGTVFEQASTIGGLWVYSEKTGPNVFSPLYRDMRTNLPKQVMSYLDFPFPNPGNSSPSFLKHNEVLEYLQSYANNFDLLKHIQFNKRIVDIKPIFPNTNTENEVEVEEEITSDKGESMMNMAMANTNSINQLSLPKWHVFVQEVNLNEKKDKEMKTATVSNNKEISTSTTSTVTSKNLTRPKIEKYEFDSVLICNGHFYKPMIPDIPHITEFQGEILHSKDYRVPENFQGKRVIICGLGPSGIDIALEISQVASKVILSYKGSSPPAASDFPSNVKVVPCIKTVKRNGFTFQNDEEVEKIEEADSLIFCTGYEYDFPFLSPEPNELIRVQEGKKVTPLFRHMIHTKFPNLCFIGIPFRITPFILYDCQVIFYVKYLEGLINLPSEEQMNLEIIKEQNAKNSKGLSLSLSHQLDSEQWAYYETLADEARFRPYLRLLPMIQKIYETCGNRRRKFASVYKDDLVRIVDEENLVFEYIEAPLFASSAEDKTMRRLRMTSQELSRKES